MRDEWSDRDLKEKEAKGGAVRGLPVGMKFDPRQGQRLELFFEQVSREVLRVLKPGGFMVSLVVPVCPHGSHSVAELNGCSETVCNSITAVPTVSISANVSTVSLGQAAIISWTSANATACTASNALGTGSFATSGSLFETPPSLEGGLSMVELAKRSGFSRSTLYLLKEAHEKEGLAGLMEKSRAQHTHPKWCNASSRLLVSGSRSLRIKELV
jgi:hypothetical protein